jgi:hypothetical protein
MGKLEFGTYDNFAVFEMQTSQVAADVYEQHIQEVRLAEELGYSYYFIIEHQNSNVGQITAPSVYLSAVAQRTSRIRFGTMIYSCHPTIPCDWPEAQFRQLWYNPGIDSRRCIRDYCPGSTPH